MDVLTSKTIIDTAGCLAIAVACYVTKSGLPLWALILVGIMLDHL